MNTQLNKKRDGFKGERLIVLPIEVFADYVKHPQVKRMYLTDIGFFPKAKYHYRERKEGVDQYIFFYCTDGKGIISVNGKQYELHKDEAFCIPRNQPHTYYACDDDPWSILWVHLKGDDTKYFPLEECKIIHFSTEASTNRMFFFFDLLFRVLEVTHYSLGNFIYISQVLNLILAETYCREKPKSISKENRYVTHIIRFMYKNLHRNLTLNEVLTEFDYSKSYLNDIFQKATKHSPMDFYLNIKMQEACKLLRSSDLLIYEIAQQLGYKDQYYFSRIFKKVIGTSPLNYRNK